jgi:hypothetical protein
MGPGRAPQPFQEQGSQGIQPVDNNLGIQPALTTIRCPCDPAPSPPAVACCSRSGGPTAVAPWSLLLRDHRWPGHQAMAPPAFPNPPDPEDTSSRRWSWRCPAWAFVGNASVSRRCWPDSKLCRTRTAPPISRLRTKAAAAMRILHTKCRRVLLGSGLGCQVCETLTVGDGNARREGG